METHFFEQVFPILSPLAIDPAHPFPFIANGGFAMGLQLRREADDTVLEALLPVPAQVPRFVRLPEGPKGQIRFLPLEALLEVFLGKLFPGYAMLGHCAFRVLRDSDLEVEEEAEDLVREFETALKRRRRGEVIRLTMTTDAPADLRKTIVAGARRRRPTRWSSIPGIIGMADLAELTRAGRPDLLWPPFTPRMPERVQDFEGDIFAAIRQKDMLLHHPYETFDIVVGFLQQAARDPDVLAIKQTLYRTSRDSPIVAALCEAAEDGKSVTALIELKARFDEAANIRQSPAAGAGRGAGGLRLHRLEDPRQDLDRGAARGRRAGHLHPLRHRQLPSGHRRTSTPTSRSSPATRRSGGTRRGCSTTSPATCSPEELEKLCDLAAHDQAAHPRGAGRRDRPCRGRAAGAGLGQAERRHRSGGDRRALRGEPAPG